MIKVHSIESMGTFDGPGIRLVIFLQGCNFRCLYCANPDTISKKGGTLTSSHDIVEMAKKQRPFFGTKGGVTISGGEPLLQAKNLTELFRELRAERIHTCIDTNGAVLKSEVKKLMEYTDLVLLDIKHISVSQHRYITQQESETTLQFADYLRGESKPVWLRYVLVPGLTDDKEAIHKLGQRFVNHYNIQKIEIQPYHKLGVHKYEHLGMQYKLQETPENTAGQLKEAYDILSQYFKEVVIN